MSNVAGKAYAMNVLTPSNHRSRFNPLKLEFAFKATWLNELIFLGSRGIPKMLTGLLGLSLIHFARWLFIRPHEWPYFDPDADKARSEIRFDYMVFCSNFNGTWDQYIDAFSDGIPNRLDQAWYTAVMYPLSIPVSQFKRYITHNQIDTDYYYDAVPGAAQRDVKSGLHVRREVMRLADIYKSCNGDAGRFMDAYRQTLGQVQNNLGEAGFAPVASNATELADIHRLDAERERRWASG